MFCQEKNVEDGHLTPRYDLPILLKDIGKSVGYVACIWCVCWLHRVMPAMVLLKIDQHNWRWNKSEKHVCLIKQGNIEWCKFGSEIALVFKH